MRTLSRYALASALGLSCATAAFSNTTYSWTLSNPSGAVAGPHTYLDSTLSTYSLVISGYKTTYAPSASAALGSTWGYGSGFTYSTGKTATNSLYGKTSGTPSESGLGLNGLASDHEIQAKSFVQIDVQNLYTHHLADFSLGISSIQSGEGFMLWGSNTAGTPGKLLKVGKSAGGTTQNFAVPDFGSYRYFSVSALYRSSGSSDVLITNGVTAQSVPEPTSLVLLASGGLALLKRRKRG